MTLTHDQLLWRIGQHLLLQRPHRLRDATVFNLKSDHGGPPYGDPWHLHIWGRVEPCDTFMVSGEEFILPYGAMCLTAFLTGLCLEGHHLLSGCPLLGVHVHVEGCDTAPSVMEAFARPDDLLHAMRDAGRRVLSHVAQASTRVDPATGRAGTTMNLGKQSPRQLSGLPAPAHPAETESSA